MLQDRFASPGESKYPTEILHNPLPFPFWVLPWFLGALRTKPPALSYFTVFPILPNETSKVWLKHLQVKIALKPIYLRPLNDISEIIHPKPMRGEWCCLLKECALC